MSVVHRVIWGRLEGENESLWFKDYELPFRINKDELLTILGCGYVRIDHISFDIDKGIVYVTCVPWTGEIMADVEFQEAGWSPYNYEEICDGT